MRKIIASIVMALAMSAVAVPAHADSHTTTVCPRQVAHPGKPKCFTVAAQHHARNFNPYAYGTHRHGHKVWVDVVGYAWKSKHDAVRSSKRIIKYADSIWGI